MRSFLSICLGLGGLVMAGCATPSRSTSQSAPIARPTSPEPLVVQTGYRSLKVGVDSEELLPASQSTDLVDQTTADSFRMGLPELIQLTLENNPRIAQVGWAVETARGRAVQAGLYPNPTFSVTGNELGDRTGPSGIWSAYTGQEIVTANKLGLSQAAACKEVDQATLNLMTERYKVFTDVRQSFFELATLQNRATILGELVKLAEQSTQNAEKLLESKEASQLDVVQLQVDLERYRADLQSTQRALPAARRKLAASVGVQSLELSAIDINFETLPPDLDLDQIRTYVLGVHPELRSAQVGVERAQLLVKRAEVEPLPNVTVGAGYTRQGQNRSDDWDIGVSVPIPLWNKNQGNILAARAQLNEARSQIGRVENELVERLATAYGDYAASRERAERYRLNILPKAQQTYQLSLSAYQGGQFEYLRVLAAQQTVAEANLERVRMLGETWNSASVLAGLMLEDQWPLVSVSVPPAPEWEKP